MATTKKSEDKELSPSEKRTLYHAFKMLLRRAMVDWDRYVNLQTGVVSIPITDWDRVQNPVLGEAASLEFDVSAFRLSGTYQRIPLDVLNRNHSKKKSNEK